MATVTVTVSLEHVLSLTPDDKLSELVTFLEVAVGQGPASTSTDDFVAWQRTRNFYDLATAEMTWREWEQERQ